ncbi:MAG: DUF819 family protein [Bacteroidales bacterium]|jgi:uncharacterized membrane protein|nr:DUF819 family protein [Bacteroidales bacterium]MDX9927522.1 DUF819 family protein [Bacteroidales bacterium]HOC48321.1 DUF819 family protein [Bacteroidales bacterium]HPT13050.1 DUF819 family protein [Bacteroidales bacterium]
MTSLILLALFCLLFPIVLIWLTKKYAILKKLGAIVLAYATGIIIANAGIMPRGSDAYREATIGQDRPYIPKAEAVEMVAAGTLKNSDLRYNSIVMVQDSMQSALVLLAIPLILFSLNVRRWLRFSGKGFLSMVLALISVVVIVATGYLIFRNKVEGADKIGGMLIGLYTGGSVNLASIALALKVEPTAFVLTNTYDMIVGAVVILFFITAGPAFFRLFLPPFKAPVDKTGNDPDINAANRKMAEDFDDYSGMFKKGIVLPLLGAIGIAILILGIGLFVSTLMPGVPQTVSVILTITTLGVAASFIRPVRDIPKTFQLGMYLIIAFSIVIATRCDLSIIFQVKYLNLLLFITYAYFGSLFLHLFLSWIFRVNADDYLITTTGFVYSPPFVPMVAAALKNKDVILTGLATGMIGWIIGNYIGVAFGMWLGKL